MAVLSDDYEIGDSTDFPSPKRREGVRLEAFVRGYKCRFGAPRVLQLDIDSESALQHCVEQIRKFEHALSIKSMERTTSSHGNTHLYLFLDRPLSRENRLFWQVALGGDPVKGALDWMWFQAAREEECFLIETPECNRRPFTINDVGLWSE